MIVVKKRNTVQTRCFDRYLEVVSNEEKACLGKEIPNIKILTKPSEIKDVLEFSKNNSLIFYLQA